MAAALRAGFVYFTLILAAGFVLGTLRVSLILPRFGATFALLVELPLILTICWFSAKRIVEKLAVPPIAADRLVMGALAFVCLVFTETIFAAVGAEKMLIGNLRSVTTPQGVIGLVSQLFFAMFPYLLLRKSAVDE